MYHFQASLFWSSLVYFVPFGGDSVAFLHKAKGGAELVPLIYLTAQGTCWGHLTGKGLLTGFFPWISTDCKGWDVIQGVFSVFSRNERAECQRMAFSTEGHCSTLKWCGGFDDPSNASPGLHGIQAGFLLMLWLVIEMGSLGVSSAIKALWDSGCV